MKKHESAIQAIKFTLFSMSAGIIQAVSYGLLYDVIGIHSHVPCYLVSLILSVLWNFTLNRKYTFRSDLPIARQMLLVALYYAVFTPVSLALGSWLEAIGLQDTLATICVMLLNFVTEFLFQKFVVYREGEKR